MDVAAGLTQDRWLLDRAVYTPGQAQGHYESFYQRANHPSRPLAFWIRYTIFASATRPYDAIGELWAIFFDGETGQHVVAKSEFPMAQCDFGQDTFAVRIDTATLGPSGLIGTAGELSWDLTFSGTEAPLLLLPPKLYAGGFPKAKSLVPLPLASFVGNLMVSGRTIDVDGWVGSQNHNWGSQHTDRYAFGQVAGFDDEPGAFLEIATVKAKVAGPIRTPWLTSLVLRDAGREHSLVTPRQALKASGKYRYFHWEFASRNDDVEISGAISAEPGAFVGLAYQNPPGGVKHCLNTKIATAELTLREKGGRARTLHADSRALFEILTDDRLHGIAIRA